MFPGYRGEPEVGACGRGTGPGPAAWRRSGRMLEAHQLDEFHRDGYVIVRALLDAAEVELVKRAALSDRRLRENAMTALDAAGRSTNLTLWNHPGDDVYGMVARSHRVVDAMEQLLGGEVYHYHSKLSAKEPKVGGAWEWHQDYGYWYQNGCLTPDMASVVIALDRADRDNGCLEVLRGSQRMGRIEHGTRGDQTGADPSRVEAALARFERVPVELDPGDGLFFHCNLLHSSSPNESERARWALICCYNTRENDPFEASHHPRYTPLAKVEDCAIREMGAKGSHESQTFLDPRDDRTNAESRR